MRPESYGKAVENGAIRYVSPSAISKFTPDEAGGCNRRWFIRYVEGEKEPERAWLSKGTDGHAQIENTAKTGQDSLSPRMRPAKPFIPETGADLRVEWALTDPSVLSGGTGQVLRLRGVPVIGYIDLMHSRPWYIDENGQAQPMPQRSAEVIDWKTTKSIEKYAKRGEDLIKTIQMPIYALRVELEYPRVEQIRLSHVYAQTEGAKLAVKRTALVGLTVVHQRRQSIESIVGEMVDVAKERDYQKVTPNWDACNAYGGCPFKHRCPRSNPLMSLLSKVQARQAANTTPPPAAASAAPTPPPAVVTAGESAEQKTKRLEAEIAALRASATTPPAPPVTTTTPKPPPVEVPAGCRYIPAGNFKAGLYKPGDVTAGHEMVLQAFPDGGYLVKPVGEPAAPVPVASPPPAAASAPEPAPAAPAAEPTKTRGRPRKLPIVDVKEGETEEQAIARSKTEGLFRVKEISVALGATVPTGEKFTSARVDIEFRADVSGDENEALKQLTAKVEAALEAELSKMLEEPAGAKP